MSEIKLTAQPRTEFGKGAARRTRRAGYIPAVLSGHGSEPVHLSLPQHDATQALKHSNALIELHVADSETELCLAKDIQRDPVKRIIEHIDLVIVKRGEKVEVDVPIHTVGEAKSDAVVTVENATVLLEVEATHIPDHIEVSIEDCGVGTQILASELALPQGATLAVDGDLLIINVTEQQAVEEPETDEAAEPIADNGGDDSDAGDASDDG